MLENGGSYDSLRLFAVPSYSFSDVCKLDELTNDILEPQSTLYMVSKGRPFEFEKEVTSYYLI